LEGSKGNAPSAPERPEFPPDEPPPASPGPVAPEPEASPPAPAASPSPEPQPPKDNKKLTRAVTPTSEREPRRARARFMALAPGILRCPSPHQRTRASYSDRPLYDRLRTRRRPRRSARNIEPPGSLDCPGRG